MSEVIEFDPFTEVDVAEDIAPETEAQIETANPDNLDDDAPDGEEDNQEEEQLAPEPEQPKEKKTWGARERDKRIEAENALNAERERAKLVEYQNQQLQKAIDELLKGKQQPQDNSADIDALLQEHGINPDDVIDKDALAATLKAGRKTNQTVQELQNQMIGEGIRNSFAAQKAQNADFEPAALHYTTKKFNEAKAAVQELGYNMTDDEIGYAVVVETQKILRQARELGKDPATVLFNLAKASGYKSSGKTKALKEEINYDKLNELRNAAAKPAYNPKIAQTSDIEEDDWAMAVIR